MGVKRWGEVGKKLVGGLKRYKYAALILVAGIALLLLPSSGKAKTQETPVRETERESDYAAQTAQQLRTLLAQIDGAGRVEVMLTLKSGARTQYQTDGSVTTQTDESGTRAAEELKTVILSEGSEYDKAAVSAVEYPQFQGALIVCDGAGSASVKLSLIEAVAALTGLSSGQITVVKMK